MKKISIILSVIFFCISCSKKDDPGPPINNSEFKALLVFSDSTQRIEVTGTSARMGCSYGTTFVSGQREDDAYIELQLHFGELRCLMAPGTFTAELQCQYRPNLYFGNIYGNDPARPGSITFTTVNAKFMEGHFETVCFISTTDSIIITGTFKGVYL
jgi:hypothetical protein